MPILQNTTRPPTYFLPTNFTFQTRWGRNRASWVRRDILLTICPNTDFIPSGPARPPLLRDRFTWIRFSSITGPCCLSRTIVACTTCWMEKHDASQRHSNASSDLQMSIQNGGAEMWQCCTKTSWEKLIISESPYTAYKNSLNE